MQNEGGAEIEEDGTITKPLLLTGGELRRYQIEGFNWLKVINNIYFIFILYLVNGELVLYVIFQPCLVIYGGQFPQLEEQIVPWSEAATVH